MIQTIVKDIEFLSQKAEVATLEDVQVGQDLLDTLQANAQGCVGLAGNMIGVNKAVIVFEDEGVQRVMYNPVILKGTEHFRTEEGCLSLEGVRKTKRFANIKVSYQNQAFQTRIKTFKGFTAQIIQHEVDHCNGIII